MLLALIALPYANPAQAQTNSPATGTPAVTYASGNTPTEDSAITAAQGTIADPDGLGTLSWQWSAANTNGGTYTDIAGATNAAFTPGDDEVGKFLQVCASFMDMATTPNEEERCLQIATAVANVNDDPVALPNTISVPITGGYYILPFDDVFLFSDEDSNATLERITLTTVPARGTLHAGSSRVLAPNTVVSKAGLTTSGPFRGLTYLLPDDVTAPMANYTSFDFRVRTVRAGTFLDVGDSSNSATITIDLVWPTTQVEAIGLPAVEVPAGSTVWNEDVTHTATTGTVADGNAGINRSTIAWQWQQADPPGNDAPPNYADIGGATAATFTPLQAHVDKFVRVCVSFEDNFTPPNSERRCTTGNIIANVNDAPTSADNSVKVPTTTTSAEPFVFKVSDFPFMDDDNNAALVAITIIETIAPGTGTLRNGGTAVANGASVTAANLEDGTFTWYPPTGARAASDFASFTFTVHDGAADSTETYTMTIHLGVDIRLRLRLFLEGPLR